MLFKGFSRRKRPLRAAAALYDALREQARAPAFYAPDRAPDTLDGRFDMLSLHLWLVLSRLRAGGGELADLAQALFDHAFDDVDAALREMGVGDTVIAKRIAALTERFYGRVKAYDDAAAAEAGSAPAGDALAEALARNVRRVEVATPADTALAAYVRAAASGLAEAPAAALASGRGLKFPPPPA